MRISTESRIVAERLDRGLHACDVPVVVRAPHVDGTLESPVELVRRIRDVRCEVGRFAVLAHHHAILLVAELGRAKPQRAVSLVHMPSLTQAIHDRLHVTRVDQRPLGEPFVVDDTELLQIGANVVDSHVPGEREDPFVALRPKQGIGHAQ